MSVERSRRIEQRASIGPYPGSSIGNEGSSRSDGELVGVRGEAELARRRQTALQTHVLAGQHALFEVQSNTHAVLLRSLPPLVYIFLILAPLPVFRSSFASPLGTPSQPELKLSADVARDRATFLSSFCLGQILEGAATTDLETEISAMLELFAKQQSWENRRAESSLT